MPAYSKGLFVDLANVVKDIEAGLQEIKVVPWKDLTTDKQCRDQIVELVIARLALMCSRNNPRFDSFKFNAACRNRKG